MQLICISGSSGVGKSTFAKLLVSLLPANNTIMLCGDDTHRWERNDPNWDLYTHFDPSANDLQKNHQDILSLLDGKSIQRKMYNHNTGKFDDAVLIEPKQYVIYEGLHSLYHKPTYDLADVKIYVDTDDELKNEWKIKRDTKKRGYTAKQVQNTISRRKRDESKYITCQKQNADILIKFFKNNLVVEMEYVSITENGKDLIQRIKKFYDAHMQFLEIAKRLSLDLTLCQDKGGNISVKYDDAIIISASGTNVRDINMFSGYCVCNKEIPSCASEFEYMEALVSSKLLETKKIPSMETGFHMLIDKPVVIHTHAIYTNAILCSKEAEQTIQDLFCDLNYQFIEYTTPGYDLYKRLKKEKHLAPVIFLQNHGLIVSHESAKMAYKITEDINHECRDWLKRHIESFVDFEEKFNEVPLFPDAAVFPKEMKYINNHLLGLIHNAYLTPNFLTSEHISDIENLAFEKHRRNL